MPARQTVPNSIVCRTCTRPPVYQPEGLRHNTTSQQAGARQTLPIPLTTAKPVISSLDFLRHRRRAGASEADHPICHRPDEAFQSWHHRRRADACEADCSQFHRLPSVHPPAVVHTKPKAKSQSNKKGAQSSAFPASSQISYCRMLWSVISSTLSLHLYFRFHLRT